MSFSPTRVLAPGLLVLAIALTGCSGADDSDSSAGSADTADAPAAEAAGSAADRDAVMSTAERPARRDQPDPTQQQALIKKGNISLRADDVGQAQVEVQQVVDQHGGQVTQEKTTTDDDGRPAYTRMVLRIPATDFDDAMAALKEIAELDVANTSQEDVTTQLIDTRSRLRVQRRSIERITLLFDRAESIRNIVAIESQLSRRQADLDSLERRLAYLTGQTSLSTIVVSVDQIPDREATPEDTDRTGFLAGLSAGWHGLTTFAVGLATVLGALLPWLIVVAILGPPLLLLVRALRRRASAGRPARTP